MRREWADSKENTKNTELNWWLPPRWKRVLETKRRCGEQLDADTSSKDPAGPLEVHHQEQEQEEHTNALCPYKSFHPMPCLPAILPACQGNGLLAPPIPCPLCDFVQLNYLWWRRKSSPPKSRCICGIVNFLYITVCVIHSCLYVLLFIEIRSSLWLERLTAKAPVATVLGSIPASVGTVESEGRQMKQCWILYEQKEKNPPKKYKEINRFKFFYFYFTKIEIVLLSIIG